MKSPLALTAQFLVEHCDGRPESDVIAACDAAVQFLMHHGYSSSGLRALLPAVKREMSARRQVVSARLTTPDGESGAASKQIVSSLEHALKASIVLTEHKDVSLIGGAVLAVGDERLDASVRGALQELELHLTI